HCPHDDRAANSRHAFAPLSGPKQWIHLRLRHEDVSSLVVAFHHVGRVESGVVAAAAFLTRRSRPDGDGGSTTVATSPACDAPLTFTADRELEELQRAFCAWLDLAVTVGLDRWRQRL